MQWFGNRTSGAHVQPRLEHNLHEDHQNFGRFRPFVVGQRTILDFLKTAWRFSSPQPFDATSLILHGVPFNASFSFYVDKTRFTANLEKVRFFSCLRRLNCIIIARPGWRSRDSMHTFYYRAWNRGLCHEQRRRASDRPPHKSTNAWKCCNFHHLYRERFCVLESKKGTRASIREGFEDS